MLSYQEKQQLLPQKEVETVRLGYIVSSTDAGYTVRFDGEDESSGKAYPAIVSVVLSAGDRVVCIAVRGSWVVLGRITGEVIEGSGGGTGGGVNFMPGNALELKDGVLGVKTTDSVESGNMLPITSNGVHEIVGDIGEVLDSL